MKYNQLLDIDQNISVLYIEDQTDIQEEFVDILDLYVDTLWIASNGQEGLAMYQEHQPDVIITDIQMPLMSGIEMIQQIRQHDQETPIIVTTAFNDTDYLLEAISLGVEHYLLKPVMIDQLDSHLKKIKKRLIQQRQLEAYQVYLEDRVEKEVALREAKEALLIQQNKTAEIGQMVGVIAHQWKQPLHYLNLLIEDISLEHEYQPLSKAYIDDFVQKGTERIKFLSDTMENFLSFYKNETSVKEFSVSKVINETVSFLNAPFQASGITLEIIVEEDFSLYGIENEFQQVILNLISNAKEALEIRKVTQGNITLCITGNSDENIISIEDNAGGIDEDKLEKIFELEYTTKNSGNGIGLYLVKKIVSERFNGMIEVFNNASGATFTLRFKKEAQ